MSVSQQLWTEKYRPTGLDDVVGHETAVERFKEFLNPEQSGGLPHCILAGPPGTGKTATALGFCRDFYGDDFAANVREFNASDDRGIDVIRDKVKSWCRTAPSGGYPYKVVFLDEADQLTRDAQPALRRTMEEFSDNTRFILTCNYPTDIIDPLQSRCATWYFSRLDDAEVHEALAPIVEQEAIDVEGDALDMVVRAADGKPRDAIVTLRTSVTDGELTEEMVESVTGVVDRQVVREVFEMALDGEHDDAMERFDVELLKAGANPDLLTEACMAVLKEIDLPPDQRIKCFELLADAYEASHNGLNPQIHFHTLLGHVYIAQGLSVYDQQGER